MFACENTFSFITISTSISDDDLTNSIDKTTQQKAHYSWQTSSLLITTYALITLSPSSPGGPGGPAAPGNPTGPCSPSCPAGPIRPFSPCTQIHSYTHTCHCLWFIITWVCGGVSYWLSLLSHWSRPTDGSRSTRLTNGTSQSRGAPFTSGPLGRNIYLWINMLIYFLHTYNRVWKQSSPSHNFTSKSKIK